MGEKKQINIKNRTYYFYNNQIDLKDFDARLLKIGKEDYNKIDIYYIGYVIIRRIGDYNNINGVNPLYLVINKMIGHFECNPLSATPLNAIPLKKKMRISI